MALFSRFIPDSLVSPQIKHFIAQRVGEFVGLLIWIAALGLSLSLWSYNPKDASLNTSNTQPVTNLGGTVGADVADLLIQWVGLGSAFLVLCLIAWGWRMVSHRGLGSLLLRVVGLAAGIVVITTTLSLLSQLISFLPAAWPGRAGMGGFIGTMTCNNLNSILGSAPQHWQMLLTGFILLLLCLIFIPMGMGLSLKEWRTLGHTAHSGLTIHKRFGKNHAQSPYVMPPKTYGFFRKRRSAASHEDDPHDAYPTTTELYGHESRFSINTSSETYGEEAKAYSPLTPPRPRPRPTHETTWDPPGISSHKTSAATDSSPIALSPPSRSQPAQTQKPEDQALLENHAQMSEYHGFEEETAQEAENPPSSSIGHSLLKLGKIFTRATPSSETGHAHVPSRPSHENSQRSSSHSTWLPPSLDFLRVPPSSDQTGPSEETLQANARLLETVLSDYGVQGTIGDIHAGPVVTLYELEPAPGIRSARVIGLSDDIARSLSVLSVRIATVPGRNVIGIEVPNALRETVYFAELLNSDPWHHDSSPLSLALGKNIFGTPVYADLAKMPHLLIAGTTGSGKSVGVNAMILSLLYRLSPDECRLILIDPKMLELSVYNGIPHLLSPVVVEPAKAVTALKWVVREMERRYRAMSQLGVRNINGYNERVAKARNRGEVVTRRVQTGFDPETGKPTFEEHQLALDSLPYIVVVIDEMADLMMVAGKEIEAAVQRLAQMARAAGIHVIMATQRPSVDVITGTIKANFPTRISFQVISKFDSRTILGEQGAEQLLGQGDMLYMQGGGRITRVHGPFVSDDEVEKVVEYLRSQGEPIYLDEVTADMEEEDSKPSGRSGNADNDNSLYDQAIDLVQREGKASTSFIQRHLSIGYNKAAKLIEQMEKDKIVGPANHVGKREILIRRIHDEY